MSANPVQAQHVLWKDSHPMSAHPVQVQHVLWKDSHPIFQGGNNHTTSLLVEEILCIFPHGYQDPQSNTYANSCKKVG